MEVTIALVGDNKWDVAPSAARDLAGPGGKNFESIETALSYDAILVIR